MLLPPVKLEIGAEDVAEPVISGGDLLPSQIIQLAEIGALDGFLLPDELQTLCRAVLDLLEHLDSTADDDGRV